MLDENKKVEGKTIEKDVILICKGWFDHEKYKDELEALKAYQAECVRYCKPDGISDLNVLNFSLFNVGQMYFKPHHWTEMIKDRLIKDIHLNAAKIDYNYLCWLYIRQINSLQVKKDDEWIINLSAYGEENII